MEISIALKIRPTQMLFVNNHRVLHGRNSFIADKYTNRHFQQAYIDIDDIEAHCRQL